MSSTECVDVALPSAAATRELAVRVLGPLAVCAKTQDAGALLTLDGPLGAGKSALARALLRAAGVAGAVPSPTFTLVEPYDCVGLGFYHLDLYRLAEPDELALLGYAGMCRPGALRIVEWAQRMPAALGPADLAIELSYDGRGRRANLGTGNAQMALAIHQVFS